MKKVLHLITFLSFCLALNLTAQQTQFNYQGLKNQKNITSDISEIPGSFTSNHEKSEDLNKLNESLNELTLYFDGEAIVSGETITIQDEETVTEIIVYMAIQNNYSMDKNIHVSKEIISETTGHENLFCWGLCYPPFTYVSAFPITLEAGILDEESFSGHLIPNNVEGTSTIKYTFFEEDNPDVSVHFFAEYIAGEALIETEKRVVLEEGTGTWCSWCPGGTYNGDLLTEEYDNVFVIALHGGDVMENTDHVDGAAISAYPSANINRDVMGSYIEEWADDVEDALASPYVAGVEVEIAYDDVTMEVSVEISANFVEDVSGDYRLGGVILENAVTGPSPDFDQSNSYSGGGNGNMGGFEDLPGPIPANMIAYNHVSRQLLGGYDGESGSLPSGISLGETHTYTFMDTIDVGWDPDQLYVVAWLIDPNGKIDNSGKSLYFTGSDNAKPVFISDPLTSAYVDNEYIYGVFTHDPDNSELEIEGVDVPSWLTLSATSTLGHIHNTTNLHGTPTEAGNYDVTLSISDGEWTIEQTFSIVVEDALGGTWEIVGTEGFTSGDSYNQDFAIAEDGSCYLITDDAGFMKVYKKEEGGDWEDMDFSELQGSYGVIAIASDGTPYIAYTYNWSSVYVKYYDGSSWQQVGGSPASGVQLGLDLDSEDNPVIALQDGGNGYEGWAYRYNGSSWDEVGGASYSGSGTPGVWNRVIIDDEDNIYVLWGDFSYSGTTSYVSKYDGGSWSVLGDEAISEHYVYYYQTFTMDDTGNIYVAFPEWNDQYLETVMFDGSSWSSIGSNLVSGAVEYCDMSITDAGNPVVTFLDITYSNTISTMKYDGSDWSFVGPQGFSGTTGNYPQIAVLGSTPYVAYADVPLGEKATVRAYMLANAAVIAANPASIVFDTTAVGQVADQIVTISNLGDIPLEVTNISSTSTFFSASMTSFTVEPGDSYEMIVTFEPLNELWYEGEIIMQSNDPVNAELSIEVSGYGDFGLGTDDHLLNQVSIFPNPTKDRFYLKGNLNIIRIVLMDYSGKIILDQDHDGNQAEIFTDDLNSGMYFIRIYSDQDVVTRKIVIEK